MPAIAPLPPTARSRVRNGRSLFAEGGDGRTAWSRRFRDLIEAHTADLGGDLSEAQASLVRRASALEVQLEQLEADWTSGAPASPGDLDIYSRLSNTLRRHLEAVGLGRKPRRSTPTLNQYLSSKG